MWFTSFWFYVSLINFDTWSLKSYPPYLQEIYKHTQIYVLTTLLTLKIDYSVLFIYTLSSNQGHFQVEEEYNYANIELLHTPLVHYILEMFFVSSLALYYYFGPAFFYCSVLVRSTKIIFPFCLNFYIIKIDIKIIRYFIYYVYKVIL